jgi:hypothetical protein
MLLLALSVACDPCAYYLLSVTLLLIKKSNTLTTIFQIFIALRILDDENSFEVCFLSYHIY